ncbi:hypothetical protein M409DRAFT_49233 [Zasmidium cellare ATCC 36951]|uniref:Uncharacterized protein n=1 Tax=Zasmidium cellare ATCC 36951 TaxID=1080233 RepID=A0A6A6D2U4_ZASCE|nr:uncharacterized protein M409DRAFT_49233 [Zasmidium cellare ATCC 36951]KAF2172690.1 hypothetical protein M409DRAFT_49233 [Zasmidium cellare ATCC 36951]
MGLQSSKTRVVMNQMTAGWGMCTLLERQCGKTQRVDIEPASSQKILQNVPQHISKNHDYSSRIRRYIGLRSFQNRAFEGENMREGRLEDNHRRPNTGHSITGLRSKGCDSRVRNGFNEELAVGSERNKNDMCDLGDSAAIYNLRATAHKDEINQDHRCLVRVEVQGSIQAGGKVSLLLASTDNDNDVNDRLPKLFFPTKVHASSALRLGGHIVDILVTGLGNPT